MWNTVQSDLETALATTFFPRLVNDPAYTDFLHEAGVQATAKAFAAGNATNLRNVAKLRSSLFAADIRSRMAVNETSVRFLLLKNLTLYRAASTVAKGSPGGIWWFTSDIWQKCLNESGSNPKNCTQWLHKNLAICYDWSNCDRIVKVEVDATSQIPAVQGIGSPKTRFDSPRMFNQPLPGITHNATIHGGLQGGIMQTILPFIPRLEIRSVMNLSRP